MASARRSFGDSVYRPGVPTLVTIHVIPDVGTSAWAIQETPPISWGVSDYANNGGALAGGTIRWGLFFDNGVRDFTYKATPPSGATAIASFSGTASFDGTNILTGGSGTLKLDKLAPSHPL